MTDLFDKLQKEKVQDASELKKPEPFVPTTYHDIEFKQQLRKLRTYDNGLAAIRQHGCDRHPRPSELFTLLADLLEGKLPARLKNTAKSTYSSWWWEWLSLAWERKGNLLIAYLDPEGLVQVDRKCIKQNFHCTSEHHFGIADKNLDDRIPIMDFSDDFIVFHYGRKYEELPPQIKKEACIWLPPDGILLPVGRAGDRYSIGIGYKRISRMVRCPPAERDFR